MFKGAVEDKGTKQVDDFARKYADPARPGYVCRGFWPQRMDVVHEAGKRGLRDDRGPLERFLPLPLTADPSRVSSAEAPESLRRAVADAEKRLEEAAAKVTAALDARAAAEDEQQAAARAGNKRRYNGAVVAAQEAEQRRKDAEMLLPPLRVEVTRANQALRWWMDDEGLRRAGHVDEPAQSVF